MTPPLDISWEAWATIVSGLAAVFAALTVGVIQQGVSRRLAEIEGMKLRESLFDRRFEFVDGMDAFVERLRRDEEISEDEFARFLLSVRRADLIFSRAIVARAVDMSDMATRAKSARESDRERAIERLEAANAQLRSAARIEMGLNT